MSDDLYLLLAVAAIAFIGWLEKRDTDRHMQAALTILYAHQLQLEQLKKDGP